MSQVRKADATEGLRRRLLPSNNTAETVYGVLVTRPPPPHRLFPGDSNPILRLCFRVMLVMNRPVNKVVLRLILFMGVFGALFWLRNRRQRAAKKMI